MWNVTINIYVAGVRWHCGHLKRCLWLPQSSSINWTRTLILFFRFCYGTSLKNTSQAAKKNIMFGGPKIDKIDKMPCRCTELLDSTFVKQPAFSEIYANRRSVTRGFHEGPLGGAKRGQPAHPVGMTADKEEGTPTNSGNILISSAKIQISPCSFRQIRAKDVDSEGFGWPLNMRLKIHWVQFSWPVYIHFFCHWIGSMGKKSGNTCISLKNRWCPVDFPANPLRCLGNAWIYQGWRAGI